MNNRFWASSVMDTNGLVLWQPHCWSTYVLKCSVNQFMIEHIYLSIYIHICGQFLGGNYAYSLQQNHNGLGTLVMYVITSHELIKILHRHKTTKQKKTCSLVLRVVLSGNCPYSMLHNLGSLGILVVYSLCKVLWPIHLIVHGIFHRHVRQARSNTASNITLGAHKLPTDGTSQWNTAQHHTLKSILQGCFQWNRILYVIKV